MPGAHIFPPADADFNSYVDAVIPYLVTNAARLGVSADNVTLLNGWQGKWDGNWAAYKDPTRHTPVVTKAKNDLRREIEVALRGVYGDIPQSALTTDDRAVLHLKARDTHGTRIGVMDHAPSLAIDATTHLQHTLRLTDPGTPGSKAMPEGQKIVLQFFVGAANLPDAKIVFGNAQNVTRFLVTEGFTEEQVGQTCYYRCCYENTHSERSPWSAVVSSVVG
jgi:hypothetical protein